MTEIMISILLLVVSLLDSAKGLEHQVAKKGTDLLLDAKVTTLPSVADFSWKCIKSDKTLNVVKLGFKGDLRIFFDKTSIEFFKQNYSLLLKNVQHNNSGVYKAELSGSEDKILVEYNITVQEPVSPVKLTVTESNSSACNLTVTCRTEDSNLNRTFQCNKSSCHLQEGAPVSFTVFLQQDNIICNHSNQVSWNQDSKNIKVYCQKKAGPSTVSSATITTSSVFTAVAVVAGIIAIICLKCKRKGQEKSVYDLPQNMNQVENPYNNDEDTSQSPTTTYALVQFVSHPEQQSKLLNSSHPETVYAQVNRATKIKSTDPTAEDQEMTYSNNDNETCCLP
ncbi:SLAM family member 5 [Nothobranchius furzeri]|uniref:SLAM family member 6 n=3 Tax=Nothobranchius furzeri TaxID=105023 RepID=A0A9D2YKT0_NOTFU|nr:SLAM family member 6 [Nothobranchius furzeri]KAF7221983.1 SLAM family member 6 [Nothobranchius furzeri]